MTSLSDPIFHDEVKARAHLEAVRWPNGPFCPHCGEAENVTRLEGKSHRPGLLQCNSCREHFSVTVGTVMERSHIALHKWVLGFHLMAASKKGVSAHQLHRMLGITYKSAWFMAHRIREAMRVDGQREPVGGEGKTVEIDETYQGKVRKPRTRKVDGGKFKGSALGRGPSNKRPIIALVERGGQVRSFHVKRANKKTVMEIVHENIDRETRMHTDESALYTDLGKHFPEHSTVQHSKDEYVRGDVHSNTIENYFSVFKRGMRGVYQHCGEQHLHRYLSEFDFRFNHRTALGVDDLTRTNAALKGIGEKRLTYRRLDREAYPSR